MLTSKDKAAIAHDIDTYSDYYQVMIRAAIAGIDEADAKPWIFSELISLVITFFDTHNYTDKQRYIHHLNALIKSGLTNEVVQPIRVYFFSSLAKAEIEGKNQDLLKFLRRIYAMVKKFDGYKEEYERQLVFQKFSV